MRHTPIAFYSDVLLIVLLQAFQMAFPEREWVCEGCLVAPEDMVNTKRQSTLKCLEYLRKELTGSRRSARPKGPHEIASPEDILEGLVVDAYAEVLEGWHVVPKSFF